MTRKEIRPRKARLLGNILPNHNKFMETAEYEDFIVERTDGKNTTYKGITNSSTMDLNLLVKVTEMTVTASDVEAGEPCNISVTLIAEGTPLANKYVNIKVAGVNYGATTGSDGVATFTNHYINHEVSDVPVYCQYLGDTIGNYGYCEASTTYNVSIIRTSLTVSSIAGYVNQSSKVNFTIKELTTNHTPVRGMLYLKDADDNILQEINLLDTNNPEFYVTPHGEGNTTYKIVFDGVNKYQNQTKTFIVNAVKKGATILVENVEGVIGHSVEIPFVVRYGNSILHEGSVQLKDGNNLVGTANLDLGATSVPLIISTLGNKSYTVEYASLDYSASNTVTVKGVKENVSFGVAGAYIMYNEFNDEGLTVTTKGAITNDAVHGGTVNVIFIHNETGISETVGTYDLANTDGVFELKAKDLNFTNLFNRMENANKLIYTAYDIKFVYSPTSNSQFLATEQISHSKLLKAKSPTLTSHITVNNTVPTLNNFPTNYHKYGIIRGTTVGISYMNFGLIPLGSVICFDNIIKSIRGNGSQLIGGVNYDIHMKINDGQEQDISSAMLNGGTSSTTDSLKSYVRLTNATVSAGDIVQIIFYFGKNAGLYDGLHDDSYGLKMVHVMEISAYGTANTYPSFPVPVTPISNWNYGKSSTTATLVSPTIEDDVLLCGRGNYVCYKDPVPHMKTGYLLRITFSMTNTSQQFRMGRLNVASNGVYSITNGVYFKFSDYIDESMRGNDIEHILECKFYDDIVYFYIDELDIGLTFDTSNITFDPVFAFYDTSNGNGLRIYNIEYDNEIQMGSIVTG